MRGPELEPSLPGTQRRAARVLAALALLAVVLTGCAEEPQPDPIRPVRSIKVGDIKAIGGRWWPGRAKATQEIDLGFEVTGQLIERPVNVGDEVTPGTVLARLDSRDYDNALTRSKAERDRARAYYDRVAEAAKTEAVSKQDVSDARARYDQSEAQVKIRQKAVDDAVMVAPFEGVVSRTYVDNFQNVQVKQPVIRLLDVAKIEMVINIPEHLINLAPYIDWLEVRFDALPGPKVKAQIKEVSNEASYATRTYPVTLIMDATVDGKAIQPGMAGEATAIGALPAKLRGSGLEVPPSALFTPDDGEDQATFVWLVDEQSSTVHARKVVPGDLTVRGGVLVEGLEPGERVVTAGAHHLRDGQEVRVQ